MHRIINPYKMATAVREGKVGKKEFIVYIFVLVIFSLLGVLFIATVQLEDPLMRYVFHAINALGSLIPFTVALIANYRGDSNHFWYRFISINIPIIFILSFSVLIASIFYTSFFLQLQPTNNPPFFSWDDILVGAITMTVGSIMIYRYMRIASSVPAIK